MSDSDGHERVPDEYDGMTTAALEKMAQGLQDIIRDRYCDAFVSATGVMCRLLRHEGGNHRMVVTGLDGRRMALEWKLEELDG